MDELQISGKRFISSRRAAKDNGYTTDYIGQLIRAGKVRGQKVGRAWYVEADSFSSYLENGHTPEPVVESSQEEIQGQTVESPVAEIEAPAPVVVESAPEPVEEISVEVKETEGAKEEPIVVRIAEPVRENEILKETVVEKNSETVEEPVEAPVVVKIRKARTEGLTYITSEEPLIPRVESRHAVTSVMPAVEQDIEEEEEYTPAPRTASRGWGDTGVVVAGFAVFVACAVLGSSMAATLHLEEGSPASVGYIIEW